MSNSELTIYEWSYVKSKRNFRIFIAERPDLYAESANWADALDELADKLVESECAHPILRPKDGFPVDPKRADIFCSRLLGLGYNEMVEASVDQIAFCYEGGLCSKCRAALGPRNSQSIRISSKPKSDIFGIRNDSGRRILVSQLVKTVIEAMYPALIRYIPVLFLDDSIVAWELDVEVVGSVVKTGRLFPFAWKCGACGCESFTCAHPALKSLRVDYISRSLEQSVRRHVFAVSSGTSTRIVVRGDRLQRELQRVGARGIVMHDIGVIAEYEIADLELPGLS